MAKTRDRADAPLARKSRSTSRQPLPAVGGPRPAGARRPTGPPPADATNAILLGTILDDVHGAPIPGVVLTAHTEVSRPPARGRPGRKETITVGSGRTGPDGTFVLGQTPDLPDWIATLADCRPDQLPMIVDWRFERKSGTFGVIERRQPGEPVARVVELRLHLDIPKTRPDWKTLAGRARATGAVRLNELVLAIREQVPVVGAGTALRAVTDLEAAFLDPSGTLSKLGPLPAWADLAQDGAAAYEQSLGRAAQGAQVQAAIGELRSRLASFDSLTQVDWPMDMQKIGRGSLVAGVNASADLFKKLGRGAIFDLPCKDPMIGYRDYLVSVWATLAKQDWYWAFQGKLTLNEARDQLTNRFHQDFTTTDTTRSDATELAIVTVTRLLTEPAPTGLAVAAGTLPARATDTSTMYLQKLVAVSGVSSRELGLRYRIGLDRVSGQLSSPVDENIATLLGLFRDSFQSETDPFHTAPDIRKDTMIPGWQLGKAPFFLEYEEWLAATAPFYGQNVFSMTRSLRLSELSSRAKDIPSTDSRFAFTQKAFPLFDQIDNGLKYISNNEYRLGIGELEAAHDAALSLIADQQKAGYQFDPPMQARRARHVTNKTELLLFERYLGLYADGNTNPYPAAGDYLIDALTSALVLYVGYFYWVMRSDASLEVGDFTEAAKCLEGLAGVAIGAAEQDNPPGYSNFWGSGEAYLYTAGPLSYTSDRSAKVQNVIPWWHDLPYEGAGGVPDYQFPTYRFRPLLHKVDLRFVELRLGNVLLEWADALFRADDPSSISRARELYKAVLWLHGEDPGISPTWPLSRFSLPHWGGYYACQVNPAVTSQVQRARLGFTKIEAGLNYFGSNDAMVPVLRYRTLKDTADRYAALAKAAERDFLTAIANLEGLSIEQLRTSNLLVKARAQRDIAGEQEKIAEYNVKVATQQVADVNAQIAAKQKEIADHDSFLGQLGDFASGIVKTFTGLPGGVTSGIASGFETELVGGDATSAGLLGLGAGASIMAGFGLFWYAGYTSMSGMSDAQNGRAGELHRLQDVTLALAEGGVVARKHEVTIANLQASIASADISLAQDLLAFHTARLLNSEFWASIALVLKRVLRRYLDLGAWAAWLAERALAFEQDRHIRLIRMDYLAPQLQGVTGGDLLQSDLAELEAARVAGERVLVPFRMVMSLAEDQPLAFGALKTRGTCSFTTSEPSARTFFPGTYGHRIRVVDVEVRILPTGRRARGILVNHGVSLASTDESLVGQALLRFPDALPISETAPSGREDPRLIEVLGPFEGTGLDTSWTLEFDRDASPGWWDAITDVIIRIEGRPDSRRLFARLSCLLCRANDLSSCPGPSSAALLSRHCEPRARGRCCSTSRYFRSAQARRTERCRTRWCFCRASRGQR